MIIIIIIIIIITIIIIIINCSLEIEMKHIKMKCVRVFSPLPGWIWSHFIIFIILPLSMSTHQSLTGANVKHDAEVPILLGWLCVVDGPASGDLGGVNFDR